MRQEPGAGLPALFQSITTERLLLRELRESDAPAMFRYTGREDMFRYLKRPPVRSLAETEAFVQHVLAGYRAGSEYLWAAQMSDGGDILGTVRLYHIDAENRCASVSYMVDAALSSRGLATEMVGAVLDYGFTHMGLLRIQAFCLEGNAASERVMHKCGMQYEGTLRGSVLIGGQPADQKLFAAVKAPEA